MKTSAQIALLVVVISALNVLYYFQVAYSRLTAKSSMTEQI